MFVVLILVALLASVAPVAAQVQQGSGGRAKISVRLPAYDLPVVLDTMETLKHHEDVTRAAVLLAARKALEDLEIPVTYTDSTLGVVLNAQLTALRRLGKLRMSQILDCGTNLNGHIADQYRIRMAVAVFVDSLAPSSSDYRVLVAAAAQSLEGASRPSLACGTTGALEERVAKLVGTKIWGS